MFFSIIIPLYNKQNAIEATLRSVLAQTYTNYEIIVVDDGSTDGSVDIVETMLREIKRCRLDLKGTENCKTDHQASELLPPTFRLIRKTNGGVSSARNRGIHEAKYDYIALLDGDDLWDEHYLEEQVKLIQDFPEAKMWGVNYAETCTGKLMRKLSTGLSDGFRGYVENYFQMQGRVSDLYCSSSVVICKEVFNVVGYFDERIKYAEDNDMWFRIIARYQVAFYDKYMVFYKLDAENRAMNKNRLLKYFLPYYVDKYRDFKDNQVFYIWINRWAANHIRKYYFEEIPEQHEDAKVAIKKIDYACLPTKYKYLFGCPYVIAKILNKFDKWYHEL